LIHFYKSEMKHDNEQNGPEETAKDFIDKSLEFGKYQNVLIWVFGTSIAFIGAIDYIQLVFMLNDRQEWSCLERDVLKCNESLEGAQSICGGGELVFNTSHPNYLHSLVVQHKWLCNQKHMGPAILSASYAGAIISSLIFGQLSDKYGRKTIFSITNIFYIVFRLVAFHLTSNYYLFMFLIIIGNTFFPVGVRIGYTLLSEICDEKGRRLAYINGWVFWVVGMAIIPFIGIQLSF